jgi:hypothetical protein
MRTIKSKNLLIKQGSVYGVKPQSKMTAVGVRLSAVMNLKNTQNKRRKIVQNAKLNNFNPEARLAIREFEDWQRRVFAKNAKKGWRFFQPDSLDKPTPRSAREAWGAPYKPDTFEKNEDRNSKIMFAIVVAVLLLLSTL